MAAIVAQLVLPTTAAYGTEGTDGGGPHDHHHELDRQWPGCWRDSGVSTGSICLAHRLQGDPMRRARTQGRQDRDRSPGMQNDEEVQ